MKLNKIIGLSLAASVFAFQASAVVGDPKVGHLIINGKVPEKCELNVKATELARDILDISKGDTNRLVGYVYEKCNDEAGYTVSMVSTNAGDFSGMFVDSVSGDKHPFAISYDNTPVRKNIVTDVSEAVPDFIEKAVEITYGEGPDLAHSEEYTYSETLTFTMVSK